MLANVADTIELCDFITPAILDRTPIVAAISSSGASPILARIIKAELESAIPATFGDLSSFLGRFRAEVAERIGDGVRRRRFWEDISESIVGERVMAGDLAGAEAALREKLAMLDDAAGGKAVGEVYLVGTGPGDPDLLTFRALRLMQRADVVLYDRLIGPRILDLVRRDATRIYVGKQPDDHTLAQEEITQLLVRLAKEGQRVLRLKGGDPFIFGRGGEEIDEIARHGIAFQVVPGITAAAGCAAYAGIPLTHRDHAQACVFVTGHGKDGKVDLNWEALIQPRQTVAIYMGLATIGSVMAEFIAHGASRGPACRGHRQRYAQASARRDRDSGGYCRKNGGGGAERSIDHHHRHGRHLAGAARLVRAECRSGCPLTPARLRLNGPAKAARKAPAGGRPARNPTHGRRAPEAFRFPRS